MPVKIIKASKSPSVPQAVVAGASVLATVLKQKVLKVGKAEIRPGLDLNEEHGKAKFLVHLHKPGIWYRIIGYDPSDNRLKLRTVHGTTFDSKVDVSTPKNYVVLAEPAQDNGMPSVPDEAALVRITELVVKENDRRFGQPHYGH